MLKQYQVNALDIVGRLQPDEVLSRLSISTPEMLDYLIKSHTRAIDAGVASSRFVSQRHIDLWTDVRQKLIEARALFGMSLSDLENK